MNVNVNEDDNEDDNGLDLPSLQEISFGGCAFEYCHLAQFESRN